MSEEQEEEGQSGKRHDKRDTTGQFTPESQPKPSERSQPTSSEYTKINSRLAKQLGLTDKLADYQTQYNPKELYKMLDFMADNSVIKSGTQSKTLPENQPIAPISPQPNKHELPGIQMKKPNLSKDGFSVSYQINPKDLLRPKKDKK